MNFKGQAYIGASGLKFCLCTHIRCLHP